MGIPSPVWRGSHSSWPSWLHSSLLLLPAGSKRHRDSPKLNSPFIGTFYKKKKKTSTLCSCRRSVPCLSVPVGLEILVLTVGTRGGQGPCESPQSLLFTVGKASLRARGKQQKLCKGKRCSCQEPSPSAQGWGGGGHAPQELGWVVQPNLSFGVTLGRPENPGRTMGGSKEGCLGWWHGRERSGKAPLLPQDVLGSWHVSGAESWALNPNPVLQGGRWCLG